MSLKNRLKMRPEEPEGVIEYKPVDVEFIIVTSRSNSDETLEYQWETSKVITQLIIWLWN